MCNKDPIRINKFLSEIGYCSRREADRLIDQGRVKVNGETPLLGSKITSQDEVSINGKVVSNVNSKKRIYIAFNLRQRNTTTVTI